MIIHHAELSASSCLLVKHIGVLHILLVPFHKACDLTLCAKYTCALQLQFDAGLLAKGALQAMATKAFCSMPSHDVPVSMNPIRMLCSQLSRCRTCPVLQHTTYT